MGGTQYGETPLITVSLQRLLFLLQNAKGIKDDPQDLLRLLIPLIPLPVQEDRSSHGSVDTKIGKAVYDAFDLPPIPWTRGQAEWSTYLPHVGVASGAKSCDIRNWRSQRLALTAISCSVLRSPHALKQLLS